MSEPVSRDGTVYTETVVYAPIERYAADVPYQLAIIDLETGQRFTARVVGQHARIGERVTFAEERDGVAYYRRAEVSR